MFVTSPEPLKHVLMKCNSREGRHLRRGFVLTNHLNEYRMLVGSIHRDAPSSLKQNNGISLAL